MTDTRLSDAAAFRCISCYCSLFNVIPFCWLGDRCCADGDCAQCDPGSDDGEAETGRLGAAVDAVVASPGRWAWSCLTSREEKLQRHRELDEGAALSEATPSLSPPLFTLRPLPFPRLSLRRAPQRPPCSLGWRLAAKNTLKMLATAIRPGLSEETTQYRPAKDIEAFNSLLPPPIEFVEGSSKGALLMDETKYRPINASPEPSETEVRLYHSERRRNSLILARRPQSTQSRLLPPQQSPQNPPSLHNPPRHLEKPSTTVPSIRLGLRVPG